MKKVYLLGAMLITATGAMAQSLQQTQGYETRLGMSVNPATAGIGGIESDSGSP